MAEPPTTMPATRSSPDDAPQPRRVGAGVGAGWWSEGWRVFAAAPLVWIGIVVVLMLLMVALVMVPIVGGLAQTLLLPVFAGGVMLGCRALARGEPLRLTHLFDGFAPPHLAPLLVLGLVILAAGFVLGLAMLAIALLTVGVSGLTALASVAVQGDMTTLDLTTLPALAPLGAGIVLVALIGLLGSSLIAMACWFAPALVVLDGAEPVRALRQSFLASWRNLGAMLVYSLIYLGLAILASIPFALGWLVLAPMIAGSCFAGWRTIFGR